MPFCSQCGYKLKINDVFCPQCGSKTSDETEESTVNYVGEEYVTPAASVMTKEESIALAEKLSSEYHSLERLKKEIDENNAITSRPVPQAKPHAAFKFFWPYLVASVVALNVLVIIGYIVFLSSFSGNAFIFFMLAAVITAVVLLIVGGKTATSKRDALNYQMSDELHRRRKKNDELIEKNRTLQSQYSNKKRKLDQYNSLVPARFRTSRYMDRVKILLNTNKAESFDEAIRLLD